jgi:hypothetical protein
MKMDEYFKSKQLEEREQEWKQYLERRKSLLRRAA